MVKRNDIKHDIFISYRRDSGEHLAWRLAGALQKKGYDAFMDADLKAGQFDDQLYYIIDNCKDFILVLSPNALDRCNNEGDWVRLEIERAKEKNKNIIPIKTKNFSFPNELPDSIAFLRKQQTIDLYTKLFGAFIDRILTPMLVSKSIKPKIGLLVLTGIICACILIFGFLYTNKLPPFSIQTPLPVADNTATIPHVQSENETQTHADKFREDTIEHSESEKITSALTPTETETVPIQDITLLAPEDVSVKNFKSAIDILKGRLDIFTNGSPYEMNVFFDEVNLSLPKTAFGEHDVMYVLRAYLSRATDLYIFSNEDISENIYVPREAIESVTLMQGTILGVDASKYGLNENNYPFIRIVLSDEFTETHHEQISEWGEHLTFGQDISLSEWFYYDTFPEGNGKTFFLLNTDGDLFNKLSVYNLTNNSLSRNFTFMIPPNITWENTKEAVSPGSYQCNAEDLTGDTIQVIFGSYKETMSSGEWLDTQSAFKQRFDALEQLYSFGTTDNPYEIAIKTNTVQHSKKILNLAGENNLQYSMKISAGLNAIGCSPDKISFSQDENGNWNIILNASYERQTETINAFTKMASEQGLNLILQIDSVPWFKTTATDTVKNGEIQFTQFYFEGIEKIGPKYDWLIHYLDTIINGTKMPYSYEINVITYDTKNNIQDLLNNDKEFNILKEKILKVAPGAEIKYKSDTIQVFLGLPVDDDLPQKAAETAKKIYESIPFKSCSYNGLTIFLIDEYEPTGERARIIFRKHYKEYYNIEDFSDTKDEGYCYVFGIFNGGRLTDYQNDFRTIIENDSFYTQMRNEDSMWFFNSK